MHDSNHSGLQCHSIGSDYPWTISAKHGSTGIRYYPWNTVTGEHGPQFHVNDSQSASAYKLAELWIRQRKIDELRANETALVDKRANVERLATEHVESCSVESLVEYTFLVPVVRDSDRREHDQRANDWLAHKLYRAFGGYSIGGRVTGTWKDSNGIELSDDSVVYRVAIPRSDVFKLRRIVESCKIVFDQQTIYMAVTSEHVTID